MGLSNICIERERKREMSTGNHCARWGTTTTVNKVTHTDVCVANLIICAEREIETDTK